MNIAYSPYPEKSAEIRNEYIDNMIASICLAYPDANVVPMPRTRDFKAFKNIDYLWLNWFENLPLGRKSFIKQLLIKVIIIIYCKIYHIKIITVAHNREPHESLYPRLVRWFFNTLLKISYRIVILSDESKTIIESNVGSRYLSKVVKIPHPVYICSPKQFQKEKDKDSFSVLFFGLLRPYKNIERIIEIAKRFPSIQFTIAGKPYLEAYGRYLRDITKGISNIKIILKFLNEEDLDMLMETHSVLLLPYNIKSSLNSGVVMYALSKGINVIVPEIGTIKDLKDSDLTFKYNYSCKEDELIQLSNAVQMAKDMYDKDYHQFVENSVRLRDEVLNSNSIESISKHIRNLDL